MKKWFLEFVLNRLPLDGYKRWISRIVLLVAALFPTLKSIWPDLPGMGDAEQVLIFLAGWLGLELGWEHAAQKRVAAK